MAKRKEIKKVVERFNFDAAKDMVKGLEPTTENKSSASTTGEDSKEKVNSKLRVKLTTMINPELRDKLKLIAIKRRVNFSEILEDVIRQYLDAQ